MFLPCSASLENLNKCESMIIQSMAFPHALGSNKRTHTGFLYLYVKKAKSIYIPIVYHLIADRDLSHLKMFCRVGTLAKVPDIMIV